MSPAKAVLFCDLRDTLKRDGSFAGMLEMMLEELERFFDAFPDSDVQTRDEVAMEACRQLGSDPGYVDEAERQIIVHCLYRLEDRIRGLREDQAKSE